MYVTVRALVGQMRVCTHRQLVAGGYLVALASEASHTQALLVYMVCAMLGVVGLGRKHLDAIDTIVAIWNVRLDLFFHVCSHQGQCFCSGRPEKVDRCPEGSLA